MKISVIVQCTRFSYDYTFSKGQKGGTSLDNTVAPLSLF